MTFKITRVHLIVFSALTLFLAVPAAVSAEPSMKPKSHHWKLIAQSDLIVRAKLHVPQNALEESATPEKYGYVNLLASIDETVEGSVHHQQVNVRYLAVSWYYPSVRSLKEHNDDEEVILFLVESDAPGDEGYYYFAGNTPAVISPFNAETLSMIANEVKNQQEIVQQFEFLPIGKTTAADAKVRKLFEELTNVQTQEAAWRQLLKLSRLDVPATVRVMNDQRRVPDFDALVPTSYPGAFEKYSHVAPTRIVEAASIILKYITEGSGRRWEPASEREWVAEVNSWRIWCVYNF